MPDDRKYVRVYYNDLIRDYPEVWADDAQLATWLRLLATADPMWPTPPELPRSVKPRPLARLVDCSLVSTLAGHRYQMKGMEAERGRRSDAARNAAAARWHSESSANGSAEPMPNRNETSKAENEPNRARESLPGYDGRADLEAFLLLKRRPPSTRQRQVLDSILQLHDLTGPQWSANIMLAHPDDPLGALIEADKEYRRERIEAAKAAEVKPPQPHRPRAIGLTGINAEIAAELRRLEAEREKESA